MWRPSAGPAAALRWFDVTDYGARGDGSSDDTAAFQAAITAAIAAPNGALLIPEPAANYVLSSTLLLEPPAGGAQFSLDIQAFGPFSSIVWNGPANTSIFHSYGWKRSKIEGVEIRLPAGATGVVAWDIDHDATRGSTGHLSFSHCDVTTASALADIVGWRLGHTAGSELSYINWNNCSVENGGVATGTPIGWVNEDPNGFILCWFNCSAAYMGQGWTNNSTAGAASVAGGASMFWYGCGGSFNTIDFALRTGGVYEVEGGRFESGGRAVAIYNGTASLTLAIRGVQFSAYVPPADGAVFDIAAHQYNGGRPVNMLLEDCVIDGADYTASLISFYGGPTANTGKVAVRRGGIRSLVDPIYTAWAGQTLFEIDSVQRLDSSGNPVALFTNVITIPTIPTANPAKTGQLWSNAGVVTVS